MRAGAAWLDTLWRMLRAAGVTVLMTALPHGLALAQQPVSGPAPQAVAAQTSPVVPSATPASSAVPVAIPRTIPTTELAKQPLFVGPKLSPDGTRMLARLTIKGEEVLGVHSFRTAPIKLLGLPPKHDLRWYRWAGNNRVLLSLATIVPWFDDEAVLTRLFVFDLTTGKLQVLGGKMQGLEGDDLLYVDPSGDWVLLSFQKTIYDYPSVSRVELANNKMTTVVQQRADVWEWYADNRGEVRVGIGFGSNTWTTVYRANGTEKFRKLPKVRYDDEDGAMDIIRVFQGSDEGYVLNNKATGRYALYKFNFATKELGALVYQSATNDIEGFETSDDGSVVESLWYTDERRKVVWFDEKLKKHQADLDAAVKNSDNVIVSTARDFSALLVRTGSSRNPGSYYLYQPDEGAMSRIAKVSETLKPSELAPKTYITYKARDGLDVPAYLTLPVGRTPKGLPLIILPHGGPYGVRDTADYDAEVQLLANRGYAVLQPNFRGSEGYGKAFYEKGEGQWGRTMQDDLDDGMDWLTKQGTIDPKRVCIVGSSYGGYAALWGATRNPERYRCAASFAGVSDVKRQLAYQLDFAVSKRYRKDWRSTVTGDDKFDLRTVSPLFQVNQLRVPVLIAHGDDDQTVPVKQSKLYADALTKAGKPFELKIYPEEGHGFSTDANLKDWLDRLEAFLAKHNPA
jgi:dipeptidyl aminopeptidase/acylaminoacyl peptidase